MRLICHLKQMENMFSEHRKSRPLDFEFYVILRHDQATHMLIEKIQIHEEKLQHLLQALFFVTVCPSMAYWRHFIRVLPDRGKRLFSSTVARPALGPAHPPVQWVLGPLSLGIKQQGCEAEANKDNTTHCGGNPQTGGIWQS